MTTYFPSLLQIDVVYANFSSKVMLFTVLVTSDPKVGLLFLPVIARCGFGQIAAWGFEQAQMLGA